MPIVYNAAASNIGPFGRGTTLHSVVVGTGAAGTLSIYNDQTAVAANLVAVIDTTTANDYFFGDAFLSRGLFAVQTGTAKLSIAYD